MRLFLILFLLTITTTGQGQVLISLLLGDKLNSGKVEFGLDGGVNFPDLRGLESGSMQGNFNIGFYFDIKTKNPNWLFHTGVLVKSTLGADALPVYSLNDPDLDNAFVGGAVQRKINYFNVPFAMKYKFNKHFYAIGGIMPSLRNKANDFFTNEINNDELEYKRDIRKEIHQLDFGLVGGVGYRLMAGNGMNLTLRYYYGLVDVVIDDTSPQQYNTSLYLAVGIPIGVGKAQERAAKKSAEEK
ncbi:MAG: PorT family protein [Cyclobacteriaceae bacterium]|nr:PorT family protein [Cyclobacteriaceae bacterium]